MARLAHGISSIRITPTPFRHDAPNLNVLVMSEGTWARMPSMLWTLFVVLLVLWLLGVVSSYTMGGFIHILLVLAVLALVFQLISGRRTTI
jgi:hypothetical protein